MKTIRPEDKENHWQSLVQRARQDTPPPVDLAALLRSLPRVTVAPVRPAWGSEFNLFLGQRAWAAGALAACSVVASVWMWNDAVENDLPWIDLVDATSATLYASEDAS